MRKRLFSLMAALLAWLYVGRVDAAIATSPDDLSPGWTLIDFEDLPSNGIVLSPLPNPFTYGDVTFQSITGNLSLYDISLSSGWDQNLLPVSGKTLFPGAEPDSAISIQFSNPVSEVLVGWGDPNLSGNRLQAFDAAGNLIEEATPQLGSPGGTFATWIGFRRASADIAKVIVLPDQSLPTGDDYALDNIYYNSNVVPEPASLIVWSLLGVVGAGVAWRRSRRASMA